MRQLTKVPGKTDRPRQRIACPYRTRVPGGAGMFALILCLCTGCAVNDRGLVTTRLYENDTAYVLRLKAWGGHLITNTVDAGVTIGRSRRLYVYPKPRPTGAQLTVPPVFPSGADTHLREVRGTEARARLGALSDPVALVTEDAGLALHLNRLRTGVLLGARSASALLVPRDFNGVFLFKYDSENSNETNVYYLKGGYP
ncbi:MAG: hypothetical protein ACREXY_15545 [Gammaproteobacteria bacterium]